MRNNATAQLLSLREFQGIPFQQSDYRIVMSQFILKWEKKLSALTELEAAAGAASNENEEVVRVEFENDMDIFYATLMEYYTSPILNDERQAYIKVSQRLVIRLLNKMLPFLQTATESNRWFSLFIFLSKKFGECLVFIEELFFEEFDAEEKVPLILLQERKTELTQLFQQILFLFTERDEATSGICRSLFKSIEAFLSEDRRVVQFKDIKYYKELLDDLVLISTNLSFLAIQELLYYHNYNHETFLEYECERLMERLNECANDKQRIAFLKMEQKTINQFPVKLNQCYCDNLPPLKQQINNWISEEVKYLESGYAQHSIGGRSEGNAEKIQTSLSVAKLSVIIRLLVLDKIIINRSVAPMLRVVAGVFTTLQRDAISVGSLEAKYHAPDKATINTVRDMLFKWINILGKL